MNKGGIASRLINLAKLVTGRTPGALAQTNVLANMLFGAISGSGTAAAFCYGFYYRDRLKKMRGMTRTFPQQPTLQQRLQDF